MLLLLTVLLGASLSARADDLIVLLKAIMPNCKLADADLVHTDLRDADLKAADLQRANSSRARLMEPISVMQSSLQQPAGHHPGADLRGARLDGTDVRSGSEQDSINPGALDRSHWLGPLA